MVEVVNASPVVGTSLSEMQNITTVIDVYFNSVRSHHEIKSHHEKKALVNLAGKVRKSPQKR